MYRSLYCKGWKRLFKVLWWEGVGDRQNCNILTPPPTLMAVSVVSFSFSRAAQTEAQDPLCWLSLLHLISNFSGPQLNRGPLRPGVAFPTTSRLYSNWSLTALTELYNSSTPTQSPTQSLEWHVWLSSSGSNCHAVQRSISSGASVYECTMGFFTLSHFVSQACQRDFLS